MQINFYCKISEKKNKCKVSFSPSSVMFAVSYYPGRCILFCDSQRDASFTGFCCSNYKANICLHSVE